MRLTKHTPHATVTLVHHDEKILIDPGSLTPVIRLLREQASAVLGTHEHLDQFAVDAVRNALQT